MPHPLPSYPTPRALVPHHLVLSQGVQAEAAAAEAAAPGEEVEQPSPEVEQPSRTLASHLLPSS